MAEDKHVSQEEKSKCSPSIISFYKQYECSKPKKHYKTGNSDFYVDDRFKVIEEIGKGAYGVVVAAVDQNLGGKKPVAIKKIEKAFEDRLYTKRTLRELKLLRLMNHPNVIGLDLIMLPNSRADFEDIYCVSELMETDMRLLIKAKKGLSLDQSKFLLYQAFRGLKYIHSCGIIHRDLKTRNLLVNSNLDLRICDFGLARSVDEKQKSTDLTDYVITRWYRPPELLLENTHYSGSVDIWSMGIIFTEMLTGKCIMPGQSTSEQLKYIFDLIGTPTEEEILQIPYPDYQDYVRKQRKKEPKDFKQLFPMADDLSIDLIKKMLTFDPKKRISAEQALKHPIFADIYQDDDCPSGHPVSPYEFEFENYPKLTRQQYKDLLYEEILLYHYPEFKKHYLDNVKTEQSICHHIIHNDNRNQIDPHEFSDED